MSSKTNCPLSIPYLPSQLEIQKNQISFEKKKKSENTLSKIPVLAVEHLKSTTLFKGGKWDKDEHKKFIEGLFIFGNQWKKIQEYIKTRTSVQVRSHSQKFFLRMKKKYIELFGKEELQRGELKNQTKHIIYLLTHYFDCEFITSFCEKIDQLLENAENKIKKFLDNKKQKFIKTILTLLNNSFAKKYQKKKNNFLQESDLNSLSSESQNPTNETEFYNGIEENISERVISDYCFPSGNTEFTSDLFKITFNNDELETNIVNDEFEYDNFDTLGFFTKNF